MTPKALHKYLMSLAAVKQVVQWGDHYVYKVGDKVFAIGGAPDEKFSGLTFKTSEDSFEILMQQKGIERAPYLTRGNWVKLTKMSALTDKQLKAYLARSHAIIAATLTKKKRAALGPSGRR
ncbi:MAG TPA: MmcQ/YjbR family DNA-binding protein [Rhizomicrobium sp.]|jgi:predicted DNA-binding protein (MmcQ/YjbR family)